MPDYTDKKSAKNLTPPPADLESDSMILGEILIQQHQQTVLLKSIKNSITFFIFLLIIAAIAQVFCNAKR